MTRRHNSPRYTPPLPTSRHHPGPSIVFGYLDDNGNEVEIDVSNDPYIVELMRQATAHCPLCNGHDHRQEDDDHGH